MEFIIKFIIGLVILGLFTIATAVFGFLGFLFMVGLVIVIVIAAE